MWECRYGAGDRHGEADHLVGGIEGSDGLAANALRNHEEAAGDDVPVVVTPGRDLQVDAGAQFVEPLAGPEGDGRAVVGLDNFGIHALRSFSADLLPDQSASSWSGLRDSRGGPAAASIAAKRRRNFAFASRRVSSGST